MKPLFPAAMLLAFCAGATAAQAGEAEDTLQGWIDLCDWDGTQQTINACAIVEAAEARLALDAVLGEIADTYAHNEASGLAAALRPAQEGWQRQVQADIDARYPLAPGENPYVTWGSSYPMQIEFLRASLTRQRIEFLCSAWLPEQVRRPHPPDGTPSVCAAGDEAGAAVPEPNRS